jgi:hypothetical protein
MSNVAKERIEALGKQLAPGATFEGIPAVKKIAGDSNGARLKGKVAIITGT